MTRLTTDPGIAAFLDMLAYSEIGPVMLANSDDGYNVLVGSTPNHMLTFPDYHAHPDKLNHSLNSTAAGRYQIIWPTWRSLVHILHFTAFTPENQDRAAIQLIRDCGSIERLEAGDVEGAISMAAPIWASLPGSTAGQHTNSGIDLLNAFAVAKAKYTQGSVA
jgi:muramidase (phage lysozyme)